MRQCVITGATGALGPRTADAFLRAGYAVRAIARHRPAPGVLSPGIEVVTADVTDDAAVATAFDGADVIVHLAARLHAFGGAVDEAEYRRVNVDGTAAVVRAALAGGATRLVFVSSIAVYGTPAQVADEASPTVQDSAYAATKLAAERIVLEARRADGTPLATVLRLAATYGSRVKGNYHDLVSLLASGRYVGIGAGTNRRTLIYDRDAAAAFVFAASHRDAAGRIFNVTDGRFHEVRDIVSAIAIALGRRPPRLHLPAGPIRFAMKVVDAATNTVGGRRWRLAERLDKYFEDVCVSGERFMGLGFSPRFDLSAGWADAVRELSSLDR